MPKEKFPTPKPLQVETISQASEAQPTELYTTVKHCANIGDVFAMMCCIKKYWEVMKRRVQVCQLIDMPGAYYPGASHPTKSNDGTQVTMNQAMFDMLKPLVESQPYIHSLIPYSGQKIDLNFDVIRGQTDVGMPNWMIQSWLMIAFPDLDYDLSETWIDLPDRKMQHIKKLVQGKVIINFTERYRSHLIDYFFLQHYSPELLFSGTDREHWLFCNRWNLNIPRLEVTNFLELAYGLKYSRFLMCNQSMHWNLAYALGTKRVLEMCKFAPNCQPFIGKDSKGYMYQVGAEYHFRRMYNETK